MTTETNRTLSTETHKSLLDAPPQYNANEAGAWANGYNAAMAKLNPPPELTEAQKRAILRTRLCGELWEKQGELSMVNCDYKALGQRRGALISKVSAIQLRLTALNQEIEESAP